MIQRNEEIGAAQDAVQAERCRYQELFDLAPDGYLVTTPDGTIKEANRAAADLFKLDEPEFLIGKPFAALMEGRDRRSFRLLLMHLHNSKGVWAKEMSLRRRDGQVFPALLDVTPIREGNRLTGLRWLVRDITERKKAEDALRESEERYHSLYSNMREGVALHELIYDEAGKAVDYIALDVNPAFERILGIARERAVGTRATELYGAGAAPFLDIFAKVVETREPVGFESEFEPMKRFFNISVVSPAPGQFATIFEDITERKRAEDEVQALAYLDTLTGLPNRALLQERLNEALLRADRQADLVGVLFLDLDRFKPINDTMGHAVGDLLLQGVASRLRACLRKTDTVARLGGDEFVVVIPDIQRELDVSVVAREIQERLSIPFDIDGREIYSIASIGIALYPVDGCDAGTLLRNADMAMYVAKEHGPSAYQFYSAEMNRYALERLELENGLRQAAKRQEFFLHYHPQVDLAEGRITGVEALLRWSHPQQGIVPPDRFIGVLEETGLILDVGEWVLRTACEQGRAWLDAGLPLRIAVNLSVKQFREPGLVDMVSRVLRESGLPPASLELELTENMLMENGAETVSKLQALNEMGVSLAIDDFGTGYSSLGYLKNFPIDRIKIAQIFVRDIAVDPGDAAIVETILAMAHSLGLEVIAEGVETQEQFEFLRIRQCDAMQGHYFSMPLSADALSALARAGLGAANQSAGEPLAVTTQ
jgi:diguanylate cyclase (GGDEF)-like protein/PAS domain S-box-containing protein